MQQPPEEALGRGGVPPPRHQDVEHHPALVDGAPEVARLAADAHEHLVEVPGVVRLRSSPQPGRDVRSGLQAPSQDALVCDCDAAPGQDQLDVAQAEAEDMVQPHGMADALGREAMAGIGVGLRHRVAAVMPFIAARSAETT
jgi:hypothetical protein